MDFERPQNIRVGERHRRDMGDISGLAASIREVGLLHPIVITPDGALVAGARRLAACNLLGLPEIPVTVIELDELLKAEWVENTQRKDFTPSEAVAIGRALEERERERAKDRQRTLNNVETAPEKLSQATGRVRDRVGAAIGMSGMTYEKAKAVTVAAENEPDLYGEIAAEMDATGNVHSAHKKLQKKRNAVPPADLRPFKSREATAERREKIAQMGRDGFRPSAIADAVGMTEQSVRNALGDMGIPTVESVVGKTRRIDANEVMERMVEAMQPPEEAISVIHTDWKHLDQSRFDDWDERLTKTIQTAMRVRTRLRGGK